MEEVKNQQLEQNQKIPMGFIIKPNTNPEVTPQQFFEMLRLVESLGVLMQQVKAQNFERDILRYYFKEDVTQMEIEGKQRNELREGFWD